LAELCWWGLRLVAYLR